MPAVPARVNRELVIALAIATALILFRSFIFLAYEAFFDSDQAIVGLMAKHLSEGRAFPLIFYGQPYMLAVEAWLAAPFVFVAGPTVASLRSAVIVLNLAVAALLIIGLWKGVGLRPLYGLAASLFFVFAPPFTGAQIVEACGGNIEPFVYVLVLWMVRHRPVWFGGVLAIGFLNREFSAYAVPAILAGEAIAGTLFRAETFHRWLIAFVVFLAVQGGVNALRPYADLKGPGTRGAAVTHNTVSSVDNLLVRTNIDVRALPSRFVTFGRDVLPMMIGGRRVDGGFASQGRDWMALPIGLTFAAAFVRIGVLLRRATRRRRAAASERDAASKPRCPVEAASFAWYLLAVGAIAALACIVTRPMHDLPLRYILLALYIPVGLVAGWLALEPRAGVRRAIAVAMIGWAALSAADHVREMRRFGAVTEPDEIRVLADALVSRGITVAEATYWRAYKLTYLTGERVKVSSSDYVRIDEYQQLAQKDPRLVRIQESPCRGGERVSRWYLCREE
jgi:hypothetical protein